jgi:hypothetical protein
MAHIHHHPKRRAIAERVGQPLGGTAGGPGPGGMPCPLPYEERSGGGCDHSDLSEEGHEKPQ